MHPSKVWKISCQPTSRFDRSASCTTPVFMGIVQSAFRAGPIRMRSRTNFRRRWIWISGRRDDFKFDLWFYRDAHIAVRSGWQINKSAWSAWPAPGNFWWRIPSLSESPFVTVYDGDIPIRIWINVVVHVIQREVDYFTLHACFCGLLSFSLCKGTWSTGFLVSCTLFCCLN
jgi:hypothetical protein